MRRLALILGAALVLSACREEEAGRPGPVALTAEAAGYYCQMELLDHEGPKGQIHLAGLPGPIFFSQVRDAVAYLKMPEQSHAIRAVYVQDMGGAKSWAEPGLWIAADEAVFVIGSDRMGGMNAPEFVPFSKAALAEAFIARHGGHMRRLDDITAAEVLTGDAPATDEDTDQDGGDMAARLTALSAGKGSN